MKLYYVPLSHYCQKVMFGFYEKQLEFEPQVVDFSDDAALQAFRNKSPFGKVPLLELEDGTLIPESTSIIEHVDGVYESGTRLIPDDARLARLARHHDRLYDLYLNEPVSILGHAARAGDTAVVDQQRQRLEQVYALMNRHYQDHEWAAGEQFTMADCAAFGGLFYAQSMHPFANHTHLVYYYERLAARPAARRILDEVVPILESMNGQ